MNPLLQRDIGFTRWLFRGYLLLLFLVPLPLGSNRPFFWALMVAAIAALTLIWAVGWLGGVARWPSQVKRAKWVLGVLSGFVVWGGVGANLFANFSLPKPLHLNSKTAAQPAP